MKTCFKCDEAKPLDAFYPHPQMGDGHLNKCKDCTKRDARTHRMDNPEKVRAQDRERAQQPHRKAERNRRSRNYKVTSPEKRKAHLAVQYAMRSGKLVRKPCAFCESEERVEAHHHDYSKPLDVTWLCSPCHKRFHALERLARDAA